MLKRKQVIFTLCLLATGLTNFKSFAQNRETAIRDSLAFIEAFNVKMPTIQQPVFKADTFNVKAFGAKPDGLTLSTAGINKAIETCSKNGGGVVLLEKGVWLTGPVYLKSNVNLHLHSGALLLFTKDKSQYKLVAGNWEGKPAIVNESPLSGDQLENVAITGKGIIDGNGGVWRMVKSSKLTETQWKNLVASGGIVKGKNWYPSESYLNGDADKEARTLAEGKTVADYEDKKDFYRPNMLVISRSKRVLLEGVTFQNSPAWCLHPLMCEDLTLKNLKVINPWFAQNGDGVDVESCKNVMIEDCLFDVGDDGICIKSGRDEAGRKRAMPTEEAIIRNNTVYHAHGGFVIGSEMSGGARNLFVYNNTFIGTDIGLRFKTTRGRGGIVEKIYIANTYMKDIPGEAILFDMYYASKDPIVLAGEQRTEPTVKFEPVSEATPQFRDFYIRDVICAGAEKALFIRGIPEMNIKNINLENLTITSKEGIELMEADGVSLKNVHLSTSHTAPLLYLENSKNVQIAGLRSANEIKTLANIAGERSKNIAISGEKLDMSSIQYTFGAKPSKIKTK